MNDLENLIAELCPDGVEFKNLGEICSISKGVQFNKVNMKESGTYPVINGGINPSGYIEQFNQSEDTITISQGGASAGYVNWISRKFWAGAHCYILKPSDLVMNRYLFHFLKSQEKFFMESQYGAGIPALAKSTLESCRTPIPPIEVQREIVRILDKFVDSKNGLISLLEKELILRKKQYEFYRDQLLTFNSDVEFKSIESLSKILTPKIKIKSNDYLTSGIYPVIDQGQKFIGGYTNATNVFPKGEYIIFGDHTCIVKFVDFEFAQGADGIKIIQTKSDEILPKFLYYCMSNIRIESSYARHWSKMKSIEIPIPSIEEQKKIVATLDRFDKLCNDLTSGIPAEIQARQKQYEFYRDKLLMFKENFAI